MKKSWMLVLGALLTACGGTVSGTISFEGGGDASGVVVSLVGRDSHVQVTGSDGLYKFDGVSDGHYQLAVDSVDTTEPHKALVVNVTAGKGGAVPTLTLTPVGTLKGVVTATAGQATGNAGIEVTVAGSSLRAVTADDGTYTLPGVPVGARTLLAMRGSYLASSAIAVTRGPQDVPPFVLGKKSVSSGTVKGAVVYFDGRPASNIALSVPGSDVTGSPASNGSFSLTLPAGEWDVFASATGYPRQLLAHVSVSADATRDIGVKRISAYARFKVNDSTQYNSYSRLFDDGVHALVTREGWENVSHSIANLATGEERLFLVEWNYLTNPTQWVATSDGRLLAFGQNVYEPNSGTTPSYHYYSEFHVFNTTSGAHLSLRGNQDSIPANQQVWSFSSTGGFFFGCDNQKLHRMKTDTGDVVSTADDVLCMKADADHYLAFSKTDPVNVTGTATLVTPTDVTPVVANVQVNAALQQFGQYAVMLTDCAALSCQVKIIDGLTGTVRTATGGPYAQSSTFKPTNHANWARIEGTKNAYLKLSDGTATAFPASYTPAVADGAKIDPNGVRVAFQLYNTAISTYLLYVASMPLTSIPITAQDTGISAYKFAWLSPTRFVATNAAAASLLQLQTDTRADVLDVVAGSVIVNDVSAVWRRSTADATTDKMWVAEVGDVAPFPLSAVDPKLETTIALLSRPSIFATKNKTWTVWTLQNNTNGRYTLVARRASDGAIRTYVDTVQRATPSTTDVSETGILATLRTFDRQDVALDLDTGLRRQLWEVDSDDVVTGLSGAKVGHEYIGGTFLTDQSTQQYNGAGGLRPVYNTGVLKY